MEDNERGGFSPEDLKAQALFAKHIGIDPDAEPVEINALMSGEVEILSAPKVKLIIFNQDGPEGNKPVFVAVNGVGFSIPREKYVLVPKPVLDALEDATEVKYYREESDGKEIGPLLERHVKRYPFTVMG